MPTYEHQDDKSQVNPQPIIGVEALSRLTPPQGDAMLLRVIEKLAGQVMKLENRMKYLERYETNTHPPVRTVTGDADFIKVSQTEEHVQIGFDEEELRRHFPPPLFPTYLDRYRHCDNPNANPDILLPSGIADTNIDPDGLLVIKVGFDTGAQKCYYIIERNVLGAPTSYATVEKVVDCTECEDVPPDPPDPPTPPDVPDGDYPYFNGWVVADFECMNDAAGDLIIVVKYVNLQTGEIKFEQKLNCCCGDPPVSVLMDRWRPCDAIDSTDNSQDIFLPPVILEMADANDPVIQIGEAGCCYRFVEETADETLTDDDVWIRDTCDDEKCDPCNPPVETVCDDCAAAENAPSQIFVSDGNCSGLTTDIKDPRSYTFVSIGPAGAFPTQWEFSADPLASWTLFIRCDANGILWGRAEYSLNFFGDGTGGTAGANQGFRDITGEVSCVNGQLSGTFRLYYDGICSPGDSSYIELTF
jgi:hypothetical protein